MAKDRVEWPDDPMEARIARRDRMAIVIAIQRNDHDYVEKMLSSTERPLKDMTVFTLMNIVETAMIAQDQLPSWKQARALLFEKLVEDGYSDLLINHAKKVLGVEDGVDSEGGSTD